MIWLPTVQQVMHLHEKVARRSGGSAGVREIGLVESAIMRASASFGGVELYTTAEQKAAAICCGLIGNHGFIDGNKRIGIFVLLVFLEVNGLPVRCTNEDVIHAALSVAAGRMDYEGLLEWVKNIRNDKKD